MPTLGGFVRRSQEIAEGRFSAKFPRVLDRMRSVAGNIGTVIDVGASDGVWTKSVQPSWPQARYLLVEAQDCHAPALRKLAQSDSRVCVENAAASDRSGYLHFLNNGSLSGSASHDPFDEADTRLPCIAIDDAIARHELPGPYLLKLDTHGHEREIFAGAERTLAESNLVVVEAYNFANFGRMTFWELCQFMTEKGFRPAGMSDPMFRPSDGLLWQMDLWFMPATNPVFSHTGF